MSDEKFILSMDLGTTGNRVYCFDEKGSPLSSAYMEFTQYFPRPGWVEHDALEIWKSLLKLIDMAIDSGGLNKNNILSIGITNQRETTVLWDCSSGKPISNAIVWQCRRTTDICTSLKEKGHEDLIRSKTGLFIDPYFSGTKIKWILENIENSKSVHASGNLRFGTIDSWILWKLTNGKSHKTDYTNASRTIIFDIKKKKWSSEICDLLNIPMSILPEVQPSASVFGTTLNMGIIPDGIIIGGIAGDQQAAMVGQGCVFQGGIKNTYGTGSFILMNLGEEYRLSHAGLLTTLTPDNLGNPVYAFEGSVFITGAVVQWLRDEMNFFSAAAESEAIAESVEYNDNVVFVPAFAGLGAPHWEMNARGAIFGLTRDTTQAQITRAALKSIALQSKDVIDVMVKETDCKIDKLKVDGGATANKFLMQYQADILDIPLSLPLVRESTALGAAYLAGLSRKLYNGIDEIASYNREEHLFIPNMSEEVRSREINLWENMVKRLL